MVKRFVFLGIVLAAILVVAAPALAWNGAREDYTPSDTCKGCHHGHGVHPAGLQHVGRDQARRGQC